MQPESPIACTLSGPERRERLAEIEALGREALVGVGPGGALRFRNEPGIRSQLEAVIAAESQCCAFLGFELREAGDELVFSIDAPEGGESVARELAAAFRGSRD